MNMLVNKKDSPIFVTGVERSGSSLIARILKICGANVGRHNPMFENLSIKKEIETYYAQIINCDKNTVIGQFPMPVVVDLMIPNGWKEKIDKIRKIEGLHGTWMYKSSKLAQTWPLWYYAYSNAKWIIVRRRTGDIVQSCIKTAHMRAFKNEANRSQIGVINEWDAWIWWVREHEKRFVEMIQAGVNCKVVWPERMVDGDYQQIQEMLEWVGLPWKNEVISIIDPLLWKSRTYKKGGI